MTDDELFWDSAAPYGENGYSFGRGEWVVGTVATSIQFKMSAGDACTARGVMLMDDGRVYTWTERAEGMEDWDGHWRLATLMRQSFAETARGMFRFEASRIDPGLIDGYRKQVDAL